MKGMRLSEVNAMMANRPHQGTCHNAGLNVSKLKAAGHELKVNPPKVLAKTKKKFGKARAEKQRQAIMFSKAKMAEMSH